MAGGSRPTATPAPAAAPPSTEEAAPVEWLKRSRVAFAMTITVAALPILVLDNLPASAARAEPFERPNVELVTIEPEIATPFVDAAPTTTAPPPVATTAPAAPPTTAAPVRQAVAARAAAPPTTEAPAPPTTAAPRPAAKAGDPNDPATWDRMAQCEAGGNWSINTGNGYYGGLQFSLATWKSYGGTGYPHEASKATQIAIGKKLQAAKGWSAWPGCARSLGFI